MKRNSHAALGAFLSEEFLSDLPAAYRIAFLFGCTQPDMNPTTYLKGSIRHQWLRGHNYPNTERFLRRISNRLEKKDQLGFWDCYTLGKLIHYTADAFTHAHNEDFPSSLKAHRIYETALQEHFLQHLPQEVSSTSGCHSCHVFDMILEQHAVYTRISGNVDTDTAFVLLTCREVMEQLRNRSNFAQSKIKHLFFSEKM